MTVAPEALTVPEGLCELFQLANTLQMHLWGALLEQTLSKLTLIEPPPKVDMEMITSLPPLLILWLRNKSSGILLRTS